MEDCDTITNISLLEDLNQRNLSDFGSYFEVNNEKNSTSHKNSYVKAQEIKLDDKLNIFDIIDQNFEYNNNSILMNETRDIGFDDFSIIKIQNKDESFEMNSSIKNLKTEYTIKRLYIKTLKTLINLNYYFRI